MNADRAKAERKLQDSLFKAVLALETVDDCRRFFVDLCTPGELASMADRWRVAELVDKGLPYRAVYEKTGVSTATITRVARCVMRGQEGYRRVLDRLKEKRP